MAKKLRFLFTLLFVMAASFVWADKVKYTIASTSSVTVSGTAPQGSSATYSSTYGTNYQLTRNNSMTLTLKGFNGCTISNLTLRMKSNGSSGQGYLYYTQGNNTTYIVGSSRGGKGFNTDDWYGAWSTSYVDISKNVNIECTSTELQIVLGASANSIFCQSFEITYSNSTTPSKTDIATLNSISPTELQKDATGTFTLDATFADGVTEDDYEITWASDNTDVLEVDETTGEYLAYSTGNANVTVTVTPTNSDKYNAVNKTFAVNVDDNTPYVQPTIITADLNNVFFNCDEFTSWSESYGSSFTGSKDNVSIIYDKGESKYAYISNAAIRLYDGNSLSFNAPDGYNITKIELNGQSGFATNLAANGLSNGTWIGSSSEVVITGNSNKKNITSVTVTIARPSAVATPTFTPAAGTYFEAQSVTITCETAGAAIYYTTDGSEPSATNGTLYNTEQPISISATTILKAIAIKGEDVSGIASATYTFPVTYNSISALINAAPTGTVILKLTDAQVLYVNNKDMYIKDATGAIDLYNCGLEYTAGNVLNGSLVCTYTLYKNLPEIASVDKDHSSIDAVDGTATPVEKDAENVTLADVCQLVQVSGEVISQEGTDSNGKTVINYFINGLQLYDKFKIEGIDLASCVGKNIIATGIVVPFNSNPEIALTKIEVVPTGDVAAPIVFHDSGKYEAGLSVPMYAQAGAKIYYTTDGSEPTTASTEYTGALTIENATTVKAIAVLDGVPSAVVTREYTIKKAAAEIEAIDGYYSIKNNGNKKYINVAGRKTVTFVADGDEADKAGTVLKVKINKQGQVEELRSQGVDLPGYADRAMNYVPKFVKLIVDKLHAEGSGAILGEHGLDAIMQKFNDSFDYHLYIENANGNGYRIYGKTPSMKPVVDFYAENKTNVDIKLPKLEEFINSAIDKVLEKTRGRGSSILTKFKLHDIWQRMGETLTEPVEDDAASIAKFYEEVLSSEANVWNFAYQTAMIYWGNVKSHPRYADMKDMLGDYAKYLEKVENIQPDFKYYIVANEAGNDVDFISGGNIDIKNNAARTIWTMNERNGFAVKFTKENSINLGRELYTTLYTDFAYTVPEKVKAYKVTAIDEKTGLATKEEISGVIPAQTPVLLQMIVDPKTVTDADLTQTLTLSTEAGTAVTGNLLQGPDWLINKYQIKAKQVEELFGYVHDALKMVGVEALYDSYVKEYEYLMIRNAGTVNNKYFFGLSGDDIAEADVNVCQLAKQGDTRKRLAFYYNLEKVEANKAFIPSENVVPVYLSLIGDVNRDGSVDIEDVTCQIDIVLGKDKPKDNYDYDAADLDFNEDVTISDVTDLIDVVLGKKTIE